MEKLLLKPEEAAEVLSVGRTKVDELMAQGVLVSVRIGGSRRIPLEAVTEFVHQLRGRFAAGGSNPTGASVHDPAGRHREDVVETGETAERCASPSARASATGEARRIIQNRPRRDRDRPAGGGRRSTADSQRSLWDS